MAFYRNWPKRFVRDMKEFSLIKKFFRPLAISSSGALNLQNDTAFLKCPHNRQLVLTTDTMVEGVHFLKSENSTTVAQRLLRVNLSDLAASGAHPIGYLFNLIGGQISQVWLQKFCKGLRQDQKRYGLSLLGGDTTSGSRTLTLSLTALGTVCRTQRLTRGGAQPGDLVCVSGVVGDGFLGCQAFKSRRTTDSLSRYLTPEPRLQLGQALLGLANASIDVSDGLLSDIEHILEASHVGGEIELSLVPLSRQGKRYVQNRLGRLLNLCTAGDDYELVFTVPPNRSRQLPLLASKLKLPLTIVGKIEKNKDLRVFHRGSKVSVKKLGYQHFETKKT